MTPRTGGRPESPLRIRSSTSALLLTLQLRIMTVAPAFLSAAISCAAVPPSVPLRERSTRCLAPFCTIHSAILRPRPPVPPIRMYVPSSRRSCTSFLIRGALYS